MVAARRAPRLRGPRRARARRRRRRCRRSSRATRPTQLELARGRHRVACAATARRRRRRPAAQRRQRRDPGLGVLGQAATSGGRRPAATSASVTCLDDAAQARAHRDPDLLQRLGGAGVVDVLGRPAADRGQRALDGADDVGDGDLARRAREPIAAVGAALAADEARRGAGRRGCSRGTSAGCPARARSPRPWSGPRRPRRARPRRAPRSRPGRRSRMARILPCPGGPSAALTGGVRVPGRLPRVALLARPTCPARPACRSSARPPWSCRCRPRRALLGLLVALADLARIVVGSWSRSSEPMVQGYPPDRGVLKRPANDRAGVRPGRTAARG